MKLIVRASITALLLAGCDKNLVEINQAKIDACKSIMFKDKTGIKGAKIFLYSDKQTEAFNNLAKLDKQYTEIAESVNEAYLIAMSSVGKDALSENSLTRYRELIASINVFCGAI
jgi:hypothetical protein